MWSAGGALTFRSPVKDPRHHASMLVTVRSRYLRCPGLPEAGARAEDRSAIEKMERCQPFTPTFGAFSTRACGNSLFTPLFFVSVRAGARSGYPS